MDVADPNQPDRPEKKALKPNEEHPDAGQRSNGLFKESVRLTATNDGDMPQTALVKLACPVTGQTKKCER